MSRNDLNAGIERMRRRLKAIESIAMSALCSQPENTLECWKHLGAAEGKIYELVNVGFRKLLHDAKMKAEGAVDAMRRMRRSKRRKAVRHDD